MMGIYWDLFFVFFKIGLFSFAAALPWSASFSRKF